jgi:hypothetical protein
MKGTVGLLGIAIVMGSALMAAVLLGSRRVVQRPQARLAALLVLIGCPVACYAVVCSGPLGSLSIMLVPLACMAAPRERSGSTTHIAVVLALVALALLGILGVRYVHLRNAGPRPGHVFVSGPSPNAAEGGGAR